jgi:hypothetical protein
MSQANVAFSGHERPLLGRWEDNGSGIILSFAGFHPSVELIKVGNKFDRGQTVFRKGWS